MISPIFNRSFSGYYGLHIESLHCEHSQSTVFNFLDFELRKCIRVIRQAKWIKRFSWMKRIESFPKWPSVYTVSLTSSHQNHLTHSNCKNRLCMNQIFVSEVVQTTILKDL